MNTESKTHTWVTIERADAEAAGLRFWDVVDDAMRLAAKGEIHPLATVSEAAA